MVGTVVVLFSSGIGYRYLSLTTQSGCAVYHRDAILLQQVLNPAGQLLRYGAAKLHQFLQIEIHLAESETQLAGMGDTVRHLCAVQQRLGWNAAPVQADTSQVLFFHQSRTKP
nr:Uncharacterised protein [Raoultella sp. NCTC 9187]